MEVWAVVRRGFEGPAFFLTSDVDATRFWRGWLRDDAELVFALEHMHAGKQFILGQSVIL